MLTVDYVVSCACLCVPCKYVIQLFLENLVGCLDVVVDCASSSQVDLMKAKGNLLEITQSLTEGIIGGQKSFPQRRQSSHINKKELIKKALMQEKLAASQTQTESQPCTERLMDATSNSESENTEGSSSSPKDEGREDNPLNSLYDIQHIKESDVFSGKVHLTEQQVKSFVEHRKSWPLFEAVFMLSAKNGTGVDELRNFLIACAQPQPWIFSPQVQTGLFISYGHFVIYYHIMLLVR